VASTRIDWVREHCRLLRAIAGQVLAAEPDLILDNGGDLFARYLDRPYPGLLGSSTSTR